MPHEGHSYEDELVNHEEDDRKVRVENYQRQLY